MEVPWNDTAIGMFFAGALLLSIGLPQAWMLPNLLNEPIAFARLYPTQLISL